MRAYLASLRVLLVATVVLGLAYPLAVTGVAHRPGLSGREAVLGKAFPDARHFQSRPSAGDYDPTASGASSP